MRVREGTPLPHPIAFLPSGPAVLLWRLMTGREAGLGEPGAIAEGEALRVRVAARHRWGRPTRSGWLAIPFEAVRDLTGGWRGGQPNSPLTLHYVAEGATWTCRIGRELEGGTHSFRAAVAAILEQQSADRRRDREGRAREAGATLRRIDSQARFAVGSGQPGFIDRPGPGPRAPGQ